MDNETETKTETPATIADTHADIAAAIALQNPEGAQKSGSAMGKSAKALADKLEEIRNDTSTGHVDQTLKLCGLAMDALNDDDRSFVETMAHQRYELRQRHAITAGDLDRLALIRKTADRALRSAVSHLQARGV